MVSQSTLQSRTAETFAFQKRFQRRRRGSGSLADQRWKANDRGNDESNGGLFHSIF
jgi:hypothetical protein